MSPASAKRKAAPKRKPAAAAAKPKARAKSKAAPKAKAQSKPIRAPKATAAPKAKAAPKRTPAVATATATAKPKPGSAPRARKSSATKAKAAPKAKATPSSSSSKGACLVVGYDGSSSGRAAVGWAAEVLPADGRIVIVHACRPLHAPTSPLASAAARREFGRALLDELLLESPRRILDREIIAEVADKDPVSALTAAARRHGANGIVVGCQRHSRLRKAIGTVTSDLLKSSPVPVTAVPH